MPRFTLLVAAMLLLSAVACGPQPRAWGSLTLAPRQPIVLALAADPAGSNDAVMTAAVKRAVTSAAPILGHPLQLETLPVHCAAASVSALLPPSGSFAGAVGVIGPACSRACVYLEGVLWHERTTMVTPACTAAAVVQQGYAIAFRLAWDDNDQALLAARYARRRLGARRAVLIGDGSVYATALLSAYKGAFKGRGGAVAAELTLASPAAAAAMARQVHTARGDVVFFAGDSRDLRAKVRALHQALGATPLFTADSVLATAGCGGGESCSVSAAFATQSGAEGVYVTAGLARQAGAWVAETRADAVGATDFAPQSTDAVALYLHAIKQVARRRANGTLVIPRQALRDAIARIDWHGQSGRIRFDNFGERRTDTGAILYQVRAKRLQPLMSLKHSS